MIFRRGSDKVRGRIRLGLGAVLLGMVFALGGCGGGSSSTEASAGATATTSSTPASHAGTPSGRFIARADVICRATNVRLEQAKLTSNAPSAIAAATVKNETIERHAARQLAKLTPPAELAPAWTKMLGYRHSLANGLADFAAAVRRKAKSFPGLAKSKKKLHAQLSEVAGKAGFKDCGKVG